MSLILPDPTIDYDMTSGMDYTDTTIRTREVSPFPNYREEPVAPKVYPPKRKDLAYSAQIAELRMRRDRGDFKQKRVNKGVAELQARKDKGEFNIPRIKIEDTDTNTYQVYSGARHRDEIATIGERTRKDTPIGRKHTRHARKEETQDYRFDKRFGLREPPRHDRYTNMKMVAKDRQPEVRSVPLNRLNPETDAPYDTTPVSLEDAKALDLTKFSRGHFKTFNPRHIHHTSVGMGDRERFDEVGDDRYYGENLVQYPTTTTGGEGYVRRGITSSLSEGYENVDYPGEQTRLEHSNPMIGKLLNEDTILGETLDIGKDASKPITWEGTDRYGMSRGEKSKKSKQTLAKKIGKIRDPITDLRDDLGEESTYTDPKTGETFTFKVPTNLPIKAKLPNKPIKQGAYSIRIKDTKPTLKELQIRECNRDPDLCVMDNTKSEFFYFNEEGEKEYRDLGEELEPGDIIPSKYKTTAYRDGAIDKGMGGRELGTYLGAPAYDTDEEVEEKPEMPQERIDAYLNRPDSKGRFFKETDRKTTTIQGSGELPYGYREPKTYGDLEGKSVKIPKQKDEPLHFIVKGKEFEMGFKGAERTNREEVEEIVGEQKQRTKELGVVRRTRGGGKEGVSELGMTEGIKYDYNWDASDRQPVRGSLSDKKLFKDKDLRQYAQTKGIAIEAPEFNPDKGRGGMFNLMRGNKGKSSKGQKGVVRGGMLRTKYEVKDGKGKEVKYYPRGQNPTAINYKQAERPKYRKAQAPRALLLQKLKVGTPDAFSAQEELWNEDYGNTALVGSGNNLEEIEGAETDDEDDPFADEGDYAVGQYE